MSKRQTFFKFLLPIIFLIVGIIGMRMLIHNKRPPEQVAKENPGALVEVLKLKQQDHTITVLATGTVQPHRETDITPQISGRVSEISPNFVSGGFFHAGDLLFSVEAVDYQLAVERAKSAVTKAELDLATVEGQAEVARQEWTSLALQKDKTPNPLVLYQPQLKNAQASLASAQAALKQAELDLQRTRIEAPFNCRVRSESIEIGQYLKSGTAVAKVSGTDWAEVEVPITLDDLEWLRIPRPGQMGKGSKATVQLQTEKGSHSWNGFIDRALGEVDSRGRMLRIIVKVPDPYGLKNSTRQLPLDMGLFVQVALEGEHLTGLTPIPASALRDKNSVWLAGSDNQLEIRPVEVVRRERDQLWLGSGVQEGERLVLTNLTGVAPGLKLRPVAHGEAQ